MKLLNKVSSLQHFKYKKPAMTKGKNIYMT